LLPLARNATSTVMISTKAVYADGSGRHANSAVKPCFDGPVPETQQTVPPGDEGYGQRKVAAEHALLDSGLPVTVIRPGLIHGEGARIPPEWVFVKRVLDRRPRIFLAGRGAGVNQPTAAANLAALIEVVAAKPGGRILNGADPDAPSALEISRTIARLLGHEWEEVLLDEPVGSVGRHPWQAPHPVVLDTSAAVSLGYVAAGATRQRWPPRLTGSCGPRPVAPTPRAPPTPRYSPASTGTTSGRCSTTPQRIASTPGRLATERPSPLV